MLYVCSHMLELCWHMLWAPKGYGLCQLSVAVYTYTIYLYFYIYVLFCILSLCTFSSVVWGLFTQHENIYSLQKLLLPAVASSSRNSCSSSLLLERMKATAGTLKSVTSLLRTSSTLLLYSDTSNSWNQNLVQVWLGPTPPHRHSPNRAFTCGNKMSTYCSQPNLYFLTTSW